MTKTKKLTFCALVTAILCIIAPITIPLGTIPLTFSLFVIILSATILGSRLTAISTLLYLLIGACGLPVFSNFTGGVGVLFSLTGGYLFSYPVVALIAGIKKHSTVMCFLSLIVCHIFGTVQYSLTSNLPFTTTVTTTLVFLPIDIIKVFTANILGKQIHKTLIKTKTLNY